MFNFLTDSFFVESILGFLQKTGFANLMAAEGGYKYLIMIAVGCICLFLAIKHKFEPMLLVPIGFGIILGNVPAGDTDLSLINETLYAGVKTGIYPALIFLGVGALTDFSSLLANPKEN